MKEGEKGQVDNALGRHELQSFAHELGNFLQVIMGGVRLAAKQASDHPDKAELRQKFLAEHTHSEDEVRFFVDGQGLFSLHLEDTVYEILCTNGDLISVPANTRHWFDMGPNPHFVAIRLFNNPDGWVANYSGSEIAAQFNRLEN